MAIQSISLIHDYGVFRRFDRDASYTADFSKRNLLYGWNYSGKTTFSRVFRSLEQGKPHGDFVSGDFKVLLDDGTSIQPADLDQHKVAVRVFNSDFVQQNLKWEEGVEPVLIIGKENIDLQQKLAHKRRVLERLGTYQRRNREVAERIESEISRSATETAARVRASTGRTPFYRSPHLQPYIDSVATDASTHVLNDGAYQQQLERQSAERREDQRPVIRLSDPQPLIERIRSALVRTAQRDAIGRLEANSKLEDWVDTGRSFHIGEDKCQFCERSLPADLLKRLDGHFSASVSALREDLEALELAVGTAIEAPIFFDEARLYRDFQPLYKTARAKCEEHVAALMAQAVGICRQIQEKRSRPDVPLDLQGDFDHVLVEQANAEVDAINCIVEKHNKRNRDFAAEREAAEEILIKHEAARSVIDTKLLDKRLELEGLRQRNDRAADKTGEVRAELNVLESELSSEVRGADKVNDYLALYFGNGEVKVAVRPDKKYRLSRGGLPARNLSEGEKTAISLSYFLASLDSDITGVADTVVYIDDPVSSLDSGHLYNTFSLIKSNLRDCGQLFLSTHSFEFFRMLKGDAFFAQVRSGVRRCSWYLIRRSELCGAEVVDLPVVLRKYNSEYHYVFSVLRRFNSNPVGFPDLICSVPNLLRQLLEIYSSFRIPQTNMNLEQRLERLFPVESDRVRVYKFVNHLSHSDSMTLAVEFPQPEECQAVVSLVFEMLRASDAGHYNGMCELIDEPNT